MNLFGLIACRDKHRHVTTATSILNPLAPEHEHS